MGEHFREVVKGGKEEWEMWQKIQVGTGSERPRLSPRHYGAGRPLSERSALIGWDFSKTSLGGSGGVIRFGAPEGKENTWEVTLIDSLM